MPHSPEYLSGMVRTIVLLISLWFLALSTGVRLTDKTAPQLLVRDLRHTGQADIIMWYKGDEERGGVVRALMNSGDGWGRR